MLTALDGESALELYDKEYKQIDLIILDLSMPGIGGRKCLMKLLEMNPQVKVIIASGYSVNGSTKETIKLGAKGFVGKPYEARDILKMVRDVLDRN